MYTCTMGLFGQENDEWTFTAQYDILSDVVEDY